MSPAKVTKEKFIDLIQQAIKMDQSVESLTHMSYACFLDELSTFIIPGDIDFMVLLTDLYDCPDHWEYSLISRNPTIFEHVYLTMLGAITPRMIAESLGQRSLGLGFTSRVIFIYSEDFERKALFPKTEFPDLSYMQADLKKIHEIRGEYRMTTEAEEAAESWVAEGMEPYPNDSRFAEYLPRRARHWLKISMLLAASRRDDRSIKLEDLNDAKVILLEAEETMPLALEAVGQNPMADAMVRAHRWALVEYNTTGKQAIHESLIRRKLLEGVAPNYLEQTLQAMLTSGRFDLAGGTYPNRTFIPVRQERS